METAVEKLFASGDAAVIGILPPLEAFMADPVKACALRLILLGLADDTQKSRFSFTALLREWNRLLGLMARRGDRATKQALQKGFEFNEHAISRYVFLKNEPHDVKRTTALLALLVVHEIERGGGAEVSTQRLIKSARDAVEFVDPINSYVRNGDISSLKQQAVTKGANEKDLSAQDLEGLANSSLRTLLKVDPDDQRNIARWLFRETDIRKLFATPERSYYVLYRYSTQTPEIVKTFLVIDSPALSGLNCFTFVHIYGSERNRVRRITRGTLVGFPQSIYFIGMSAHVLRGRDPLGRPNVDQPQGLKIMVIPASETQGSSDLIPGVYMSNGLRWNAIVGRIALIHIGFQSVIGELSDTDSAVTPSILHGSDAFQEDLRKICAIPRSAVSNENVADLAQRTLIRINNRPFCDRDRPDIAVEGVMRALLPEDEQTPGP
jgi:hypothetical protein